MTRILVSLAAVGCFTAALPAGDWPGFRGPHGDGTSDERAMPEKWGPAENLAWKAELPGPGASSPVVLGRRVFVTCFTGTRAEELIRHVLCFDRAKGALLWKNSYPAPLPEQDYTGQLRQHGFTTSTPVSYGAALYVHFGRDGVRAFDLDGKLLWHESVGTYVSTFGSGASPLLLGDRLIVNATVESGALVALDRRTGKRLWKTRINGDCWSTPAVVELKGGARELVLNGTGMVYGFDPADGKELWNVESIGGHVSSTPVVRDGVVYVTNAGIEGRVAMAIRAGGRGDVTKTHVVWTAKAGASHTSPILVGDRLCWFSGQAMAVDVKAGREVAKERLDGLNNPYSSPVVAGGTIVLFTRSGVGYVLRAQDLHVLAENDLKDASGIVASPAFSDGQLFIRSNRYLYCIGQPAQQSSLPAGFRAIFNGKDLTGWYGLNPHDGAQLKGEQKEANLKQQRADFPRHWRVETGELVNDGTGPYATTEAEFGDIELRVEYKTVARADSGVYLRGTPQVQIWDWNQKFDPKNPTRKPHLGSGGLFNNTPGTPGRDPLVLADRPFGEWNQLRIRQIGARTWVWLNDKRVVDGAVMENFWDRSKPLPARGPIMLQTHGGEIRWRNLLVHEIGAEEAKEILNQADAAARAALAKSLTLHASFDKGLDADFSRGDKTCYVQQGPKLVPAMPNEDVKLAGAAGRFGGALHFPRKGTYRPSFKDAGVLGYNARSWSASVSAWLRLDPDRDLEPGYCDPIQITGDDSKKGYIFLEWSKDETPRLFRYAIRPLFPIWNPNNLAWADIPRDKKPAVEVARAPFSREQWTHVAFTLENINDKQKPPMGRLYLNGKLQGTIEKWDMTFDWDPARVLLVLGASYVGHLDDLAVFDRPLTDVEVDRIYRLKGGIRELYP